MAGEVKETAFELSPTTEVETVDLYDPKTLSKATERAQKSEAVHNNIIDKLIPSEKVQKVLGEGELVELSKKTGESVVGIVKAVEKKLPSGISTKYLLKANKLMDIRKHSAGTKAALEGLGFPTDDPDLFSKGIKFSGRLQGYAAMLGVDDQLNVKSLLGLATGSPITEGGVLVAAIDKLAGEAAGGKIGEYLEKAGLEGRFGQKVNELAFNVCCSRGDYIAAKVVYDRDRHSISQRDRTMGVRDLIANFSLYSHPKGYIYDDITLSGNRRRMEFIDTLFYLDSQWDRFENNEYPMYNLGMLAKASKDSLDVMMMDHRTQTMALLRSVYVVDGIDNTKEKEKLLSKVANFLLG